MKQKIPFIPIHDSVVIPKQHRKVAVDKLKRLYKEMYDLEPNIKVK